MRRSLARRLLCLQEVEAWRRSRRWQPPTSELGQTELLGESGELVTECLNMMSEPLVFLTASFEFQLSLVAKEAYMAMLAKPIPSHSERGHCWALTRASSSWLSCCAASRCPLLLPGRDPPGNDREGYAIEPEVPSGIDKLSSPEDTLLSPLLTLDRSFWTQKWSSITVLARCGIRQKDDKTYLLAATLDTAIFEATRAGRK